MSPRETPADDEDVRGFLRLLVWTEDDLAVTDAEAEAFLRLSSELYPPDNAVRRVRDGVLRRLGIPVEDP